MNKFLAVLSVGVAALTLCGGNYQHRIKCVSHRGDAVDAPEASAAAFRLAMQRKADVIKLDVRLTKDGVPVLSHDPSFKRVTGWDVPVTSVTLAEIKEKAVCKPKGGYDKEKILTLAEALEIVKDAPEFWLDPKNTKVTPAEFETIRKVFADAGIAESRIMVATYSRGALVYAREHAPEMRLVSHVNIKPQKDGTIRTNFAPGHMNEFKSSKCKNLDELTALLLQAKKELGLYGFNLPFKSANEAMVQTLQRDGAWVSLYFVNSAKNAKTGASWGADAFVTDAIRKVRGACRTGSRPRTITQPAAQPAAQADAPKTGVEAMVSKAVNGVRAEQDAALQVE